MPINAAPCLQQLSEDRPQIRIAACEDINASTISDSWQAPICDALFRQLQMPTEDHRVRILAAEALSAVPSQYQRALPALVSLCSDADPNVQFAIAKTLAAIGLDERATAQNVRLLAAQDDASAILYLITAAAEHCAPSKLIFETMFSLVGDKQKNASIILLMSIEQFCPMADRNTAAERLAALLPALSESLRFWAEHVVTQLRRVPGEGGMPFSHFDKHPDPEGAFHKSTPELIDMAQWLGVRATIDLCFDAGRTDSGLQLIDTFSRGADRNARTAALQVLAEIISDPKCGDLRVEALQLAERLERFGLPLVDTIRICLSDADEKVRFFARYALDVVEYSFVPEH